MHKNDTSWTLTINNTNYYNRKGTKNWCSIGYKLNNLTSFFYLFNNHLFNTTKHKLNFDGKFRHNLCRKFWLKNFILFFLRRLEVHEEWKIFWRKNRSKKRFLTGLWQAWLQSVIKIEFQINHFWLDCDGLSQSRHNLSQKADLIVTALWGGPSQSVRKLNFWVDPSQNVAQCQLFLPIVTVPVISFFVIWTIAFSLAHFNKTQFPFFVFISTSTPLMTSEEYDMEVTSPPGIIDTCEGPEATINDTGWNSRSKHASLSLAGWKVMPLVIYCQFIIQMLWYLPRLNWSFL